MKPQEFKNVRFQPENLAKTFVPSEEVIGGDLAPYKFFDKFKDNFKQVDYSIFQKGKLKLA